MSKKRFEFQGLEEYLEKLRGLVDTDEVQNTVGEALYAGAGVVADAIKAEIDNIPVRDAKLYGTPEHQLKGLTESQKRGLQDGFGISKMRDDSGYVNVKIGFDGYNSTTTKLWPSGQPNSMVARSLESGTSWLKKNPFITRAVRSSTATAEAKIGEVVENKINELMGDK